MGDPFKKVQRGEPLRIPAETFNTFIDAAKDFRQRTQNRGQSSLANFADSGIVPVKNASGGDRDRYDVLGIERPIFLPSENLLSFTNQLAVIGVTPDEDKHVGRFVVLLPVPCKLPPWVSPAGWPAQPAMFGWRRWRPPLHTLPAAP